MSVEEVIGRLKAYEERLHGVGDTETGHVFLSRTNWKPRERGMKANPRIGDKETLVIAVEAVIEVED